jgi:hypothetical protein
MALEDILLMEGDIAEPVEELGPGTLNQPLDQLTDVMTLNELTLVLEASFSS